MRFYLALLACTALVFLASCGGGPGPEEEEEQMEEGGEADLSITTMSFPAFVTGDDVDVVFDLRGGCGGPYTAELLLGALPDGLMLDDAVIDEGMGMMTFRHHMLGLLCKAGTFDFTVRITDSGCSEPKIATRQFAWTIAEGPIRIVKSVPQMTRFGDSPILNKWPFIDVLPAQKINTNAMIQLVPTGGQGPYTIAETDDPNDPDDDAMLPPNTALGGVNGDVIQGAPTQFGPNNMPWLVSFLVTDSTGATCICKLQWPIVP